MTAPKRFKRWGPFEDYFVVSRGLSKGKEALFVDFPTSGDVPEDNAMFFAAAVRFLQRNPGTDAVRFCIKGEGRVVDFDPDFTRVKSPKKKGR